MGFLTGFGTGLFAGANEQFDRMANDTDRAMLQRQKAVDQVGQQWAKNKAKMQDTQDLANNYAATYNLTDSDQAMQLAQNPTFTSMKDPNQQLDYVKSMKLVPGAKTPMVSS